MVADQLSGDGEGNFTDQVRQRFVELMADPVFASVATEIESAIRRLDRPLRVAVIGGVSAGKSTLVNALVGSRVGRTDQGETTYVNWRYRFGDRPRATMRTADGGVDEIDLTRNGVEAHDLDRSAPFPVDVELPTPLLRDMELIDTPGLFSLNKANSEVTEQLMSRDAELGERFDRASGHATEAADALLVLTGNIPKSHERELVRSFSGAISSTSTAPTEVLLLLSKVDSRMSEDPATSDVDALDDYATVVERYRSLLRDQVWDVLPCIPVLGETAAAGVAGDELLQAISTLVREPLWKRQTINRAKFLEADEEPDAATRAWLFDSLGRYGLIRAATGVESQQVCTADQLATYLRALSGLDAVIDLVNDTFAERSEVIRVSQLLRDIEAIASNPTNELSRTARSRLRAAVEHVRVPAEPNELSCLVMLRMSMDKRSSLNEREQDEVARLARLRATPEERLGESGDAEELREVVLKRITRWVARMNEIPDPSAGLRSAVDQQLCATVIATYWALHTELKEGDRKK